ncbi:MAG: hypothetical protein ACJAT2_003176 [Bacteriovoracaceae bacterium]|jgi:hypothetical protein
MNIEKLYDEIIDDLKQGKRGLRKLTASQIEGLINNWNRDQLKLILCILDHSIEDLVCFDEPLIKAILEETEPELLIFLLGAAQKHSIAARAKDGFPPSSDFLNALKYVLASPLIKNPEVLEWTLRTIEQLGMKSILFKKQILELKPGLGSLFNQHKKSSRQLIEHLEKRWAPLKGGPLG